MSAPEPQTVRLTKLEAAKRQIITAIWLWFKDADIVSIHTLTAAAFGILNDLLHHRKKGRPMPFDEQYMPKGYEKEIRELLKSDEVFFKHARKDPNAIHELYTDWTGIYLLTTVKAYFDLQGENEALHPLMTLLSFWFALTDPELFQKIPPLSLKSGSVEELRKLSKFEYFQVAGGLFVDTPPVE